MIKKLSSSVVERISSATAVASMDQAVAELVQNSIDAGANSITVKVDWKTLSTAVMDNGNGMSRESLAALGPHMTSKLSTWEDLVNCKTYGFRGEALASLRQISNKMVIVSRCRNDKSPWYVYSDINGNCCKVSSFDQDNELANPPNHNMFYIPSFEHGCMVLAYDMFANIPVRRRNILEDGVEKFMAALRRRLVVLDLPKLKVLVDGEVRIVTDRGPTTVNSVLGISCWFDRIRCRSGAYTVTGLLSHQCRKGYQFILLNNRLYNLKLQYKKSPVFVLRFSCAVSESELVQDPSKAIYTSCHEGNVVAILQKMFLEYFGEQVVRIPTSSPMKRSPVKSPRKASSSVTNNKLSPTKKSLSIKTCFNYPQSLTRADLHSIHVISQIEKKFILVRTGSVLAMVDQHAADERIRLEALQHQLLTSSTLVACNIPLNLTPSEKHEVSSHAEYLRPFVQFDPHGNVCQIAAAVSGKTSLEQDLLEYVADIRRGSKTVIGKCSWIEDIRNIPGFIISSVNSIACRQAIKFGCKLSHDAMSQLVSDLGRCQVPFACAHGRPTIVPVAQI
ncbi:hypothetical protein CANTEDRAFT_95827 [Yamadazyma tenuis ATCC 10573]|uniref:MutL C-terminal dimerisation domain-containing protein n=1 Tax=Candida tenuis (strain ATCC 10573 / BCRC 21748 / CBS 615 / JCM 9827 / NBRC 10315 / NRRL Y-1498 / VKM Y-70) TaxID=590646 RepID=G3BDT6_CANTC|nr:uncharacterized protein CANTEDRAFT_95827 [Yamadazyma tenuis ATCC 10573]EGV60378.1 hypothetical protein CANTEDRAFT_95827 [Yamadazyma tenuis ATCC 10573]